MTPLQELITAIWALMPGLIPYVFVAWVVATAIVLAGLGLDHHRGEQRPLFSALAPGLWIGSMLTLFIILNAARDKGLIAHDSFAGLLIGSIGFGFSLLQFRTPAGRLDPS